MVFLPVGFVTLMVGIWVLAVLLKGAVVLLPEQNPGLYAVIVVAQLFPPFAAAFIVKDLALAQKQSLEFSTEDSKCYCCTVGHRDPQSGANISCDRQMVESKLKQWYDDTGENLHLQRFNEQVRGPWGAGVLRSLQHPRLMYATGYMISTPWLWDFLSKLDIFSVLSATEAAEYILWSICAALPTLSLLTRDRQR